MDSTTKLTLRTWRVSLKVSVDDMAKSCGVHPNTYREWEKHPDRISVAQAEKLADKLGVHIGQIIFKP